MPRPPQPQRARNDPGQYEDLSGEWWRPRGQFAMLHWIAASRADLVPKADRPGALLVDFGCGAGLLAPHLAGKGYAHVGIDLSLTALELGSAHGMTAVSADVTGVPIADETADVVSAGEILEHVADLESVIAEACRVLRPGGLLVLDTIADTLLARLLAVEVAERIPGGAPRGIHDPRLFVNRDRLRRVCAAHGVTLELHGLRPSAIGLLRFWAHRTDVVGMVTTSSTAVLFRGFGRKRE